MEMLSFNEKELTTQEKRVYTVSMGLTQSFELMTLNLPDLCLLN